MRIIIGIGTWHVVANWFGSDRIVYSNENVFACIRYVINNGGF